MANEKTSQMPAAAALTGAELVEMVQGGASTQTTVSTLGGSIASNPSITGNPNGGALGSLAYQLGWMLFSPLTNGALSGTSNSFSTPSPTLQAGTTTFQQFNGAGSNLANSVQMGIHTSSASANQNAEYTFPIIDTLSSVAQIARVFSNGLPLAGVSLCMYFQIKTTTPLMNIFFGFSSTHGALGGSFVPSTALNAMGLGKDNADSTLSFMINNGSGSATKTPLAGATLAAIANHLLRLTITCDGAGNVNMVLTDLEAGGLGSFSITYPTATAKLPVANTQLAFHLMINNGGTAVAVAYGIKGIWITYALGCG
jgi:hypothetical protein